MKCTFLSCTSGYVPYYYCTHFLIKDWGGCSKKRIKNLIQRVMMRGYLRQLDQKNKSKNPADGLKLPKTRISKRIEIRWIHRKSSGFRNHFFHANRQKSRLDPLPKIQRISKKKNSREQQKNVRWIHFENAAHFSKCAAFLATSYGRPKNQIWDSWFLTDFWPCQKSEMSNFSLLMVWSFCFFGFWPTFSYLDQIQPTLWKYC